MLVSLSMACQIFASAIPALHFAFYSYFTHTPEPDRQFNLVKEHIAALRKDFYRTLSKVKVYVERNLGFEAEHHHRALHDVPGVEFYVVGNFIRGPPPTRRPPAAPAWRC